MKTVHISKTTKDTPPVWPYEKIKNDILGANYQLSLTFIGSKRAASLNHRHRNKEYIPNILSFPLSDSVGDIFICMEVANKQTESFGLSRRGYIAYLFIHGCVHLKGHDHGATMDKLERTYIRKYKIT